MIRFALASLLWVLMAGSAAWAVDMQSGQSVLYGAGKPVTQDLLAAGTDVSVRPTVNGDVTVAGQSVSVSGPVSQSIFAAGGNVTVTGRAGNDVRLAGREVALAAPVGDTAYLAGSTVRVMNTSTIGGDLLAAGSDIEVMGSVGRDARLAGNQITIGGTVTGNVYARASQISLSPGAVIKGNLYYESANAAKIAPGATVQGKIFRTLPPAEQKRPIFWSAFAWWLLWLAAAILFGVVFLWLFPERTQAAAEVVRSSVGASVGIGFLVLILTPILAFVAMITVVGLPLGVSLLMVYLMLLYAAKVFVGLALGRWILQRAGTSGGAGSPIVALIVGLFIVSALTRIPFLGWLVSLFVLVAGLGAFSLSWWRDRRTRDIVAAA